MSNAATNLTFGDALANARVLMESYATWWDDADDETKRERVQGLVEKLGADFSPDRFVLAWLLTQSGVSWPA